MESRSDRNEKQGKDGIGKEKKPFDKKKWREQRYSNKAKVKRWDEARKKSALRRYNKELKKSGIYNPSKQEQIDDLDQEKPVGAFKRAQMQFERDQEEKQKKREEIERIKKEREEALKLYREKKAMKFKKLNQKTKKGQPVMKGRIELLLEKIEKDYRYHKS